MKKNNIIATAVAAILVIGGISVFAEQSAESKKTTPKTKIEFTQEQKEEFVDKCKENLATKLKEGKITQAEYDEQLQRIESGELPALKGRGFGKGKHFQKKEMTEEEKAQMKAKMQERAKERLEKQLSEGKITQAEYDEQLSKIESGELPASKGRGFGKGKQFQKKEMTEEEKAQMKAKMQEKARERLEKQLSEGKITQEKYDEQLSKIESGELPALKGRGFGKRKHFQKKEVTEE